RLARCWRYPAPALRCSSASLIVRVSTLRADRRQPSGIVRRALAQEMKGDGQQLPRKRHYGRFAPTPPRDPFAPELQWPGRGGLHREYAVRGLDPDPADLCAALLRNAPVLDPLAARPDAGHEPGVGHE